MLNQPLEGVRHSAAYNRLGVLERSWFLWQRGLEGMTSCRYLDRSGCCPFDSEYSILVTKDSYVATLDGRTRELPQSEEGKISEGCKQRRVVHSNGSCLSSPGLGPSLIAYLPGPPPWTLQHFTSATSPVHKKLHTYHLTRLVSHPGSEGIDYVK